MEKVLQKEKRLRISILGDSISTFAGYTPKDSVFYDSYVQWETGVKTVEFNIPKSWANRNITITA